MQEVAIFAWYEILIFLVTCMNSPRIWQIYCRNKPGKKAYIININTAFLNSFQSTYPLVLTMSSKCLIRLHSVRPYELRGSIILWNVGIHLRCHNQSSHNPRLNSVLYFTLHFSKISRLLLTVRVRTKNYKCICSITRALSPTSIIITY
jgi:hypothetical protein